MYTEASWPRKRGDQARLVGGPFSGAKCMRFFYSMHGQDIADLQVYLKHSNSSASVFIWGRYTNQGPVWHSTNVTIFGENYQVCSQGIDSPNLL